jgi:hypothetical protein
MKNQNKAIVLNSFFEIIEEKINEKNSIIQGISFHFNSVSLIKILNAKEQNIPLKISESLLNKIRYYCLIDQHLLCNLQSNLNFISYFDAIDKNKPLFKTTISLDGNIFNQICDRCLENEDLTLSLTTAHYWLIEEILAQLKPQFNRKKVKQWTNIVAWIFALIIVIISILFNLTHFKNYLLLWIAPVIVACLLQWSIQELLWYNLSSIRRWLLKNTLYGLFSRKRSRQNKALNIFTNFGF